MLTYQLFRVCRLAHDYFHILAVCQYLLFDASLYILELTVKRPPAFLFYDHSITFGEPVSFRPNRFQVADQVGGGGVSCVGDEVNYIWLRPKSRSSYWFLVNRYFAFFGNIAVLLLGFMDLTSQVRHWSRLSDPCTILC